MRFVRLLSALFLLGATAANAQSIVERRGALKVDGNKIVDKDGKPIQLGGMSFYWSQWGAKFYNKEVVEELVKDWKTPIVRAAMAADSSVGGYMKTPTTNLASVTKVVEAAIANGIYVIIDWHEEMAINHTREAADFFRMMAAKYGKLPNVMFEIYNEPHNKDPDLDPTWPQIKEYAQTVIAAIREHSPNIVIVGTSNWSQDVDIAAADPLDPAVHGNVAYTMHFYAGSHGAALRSKSTDALKQKVPVFVTEWGTTHADGGQLTGPSKGKVYTTESTTWLNYLATNGISWCNWSLIDVDEGSAALVSGASTKGGWDTLVDLSPSGRYIRSQIRARCEADSTICPFNGPAVVPAAVPGVVGATRYAQNMAVYKVADTDSFHLGSIDSGDWAVYPVVTTAADTFEIRATARALGEGGTITVKGTGAAVSIPVLPLAGATWTTSIGTTRLILPAGTTSLEVRFTGKGADLMELRELELVRNAPRAQGVPGPIALGNYSTAPVLGSLTLLGDPASPAITHLRNGATFHYALNAPAAGTYTLSAMVSSATNGGQFDVSLTSGFKKTRYKAAVASTGDWRNWSRIWIPMELGAGANSITLIATGDSAGFLFNLSDVRFEEGVGVRKNTTALRASLRRSGSILRLDLPAGAFREAALVGADGRILSSVSVEGRETAQMPAPATDMPMWIRLRGTSGSRILAVPPVR